RKPSALPAGAGNVRSRNKHRLSSRGALRDPGMAPGSLAGHEMTEGLRPAAFAPYVSSRIDREPDMSDWQQRYQRLAFDRPHPRVLRVTMNRPERFNATDEIMHRELVDVWRDIDADQTVNAAILQGAGGKAFSAGGDFDLIEKNMSDFNQLMKVWKEA